MSTTRSKQNDAFRLGDFWIEPGINHVGGNRVDAKAMDVLVALADASPRALSSADLLDRVWPTAKKFPKPYWVQEKEDLEALRRRP